MADRITERPDPQTEPELWRQYWQQRIEDAQTLTHYMIDGKPYARIPYGQEYAGMQCPESPCHDCAAEVGQLHVPSCDVEVCKRCGGQAISCPCEYADGQEISAEREVVKRFIQKMLAQQKSIPLIPRRW